MKIRINNDVFMNSINKMVRIVSNKPIDPMYSGILIKATTEGLTLIGTNNEISIKCFIERDPNNLIIEKSGTILLKSKYLFEMLRKINSRDVILESHDGKVVKIATENFQSELNTLDSEDYPEISFDNENKGFVIKSVDLKEIYDEVAFASAQEFNRSVLSGVYLKSSNGHLTAVATDSFRLSRRTMMVEDKSELEVLIPISFFNEINKLLGSNDKVEIFNNSKGINFKVDSTILKSKKIEGTYPNITKVIPTEFSSIVEIDPITLVDALERARVLVSDTTKTETIKINSKHFAVFSKSLEVGRSQELIDLYNLSGGEIEFSINGKLLADALLKFKSSKVEINFLSDIKPIVIKSKEKPDLLQLVLPMKTY